MLSVGHSSSLLLAFAMGYACSSWQAKMSHQYGGLEFGVVVLGGRGCVSRARSFQRVLFGQGVLGSPWVRFRYRLAGFLFCFRRCWGCWHRLLLFPVQVSLTGSELEMTGDPKNHCTAGLAFSQTFLPPCSTVSLDEHLKRTIVYQNTMICKQRFQISLQMTVCWVKL